MNTIQRVILIVSALVIIGMGIYPPFIFKAFTGAEIDMGYSLINMPPKIQSYFVPINAPLLLVQWIGVLLVAAMLCFAAKDKKKG